jgi:hypothetical protein
LLLAPFSGAAAALRRRFRGLLFHSRAQIFGDPERPENVNVGATDEFTALIKERAEKVVG